MFLKNIILNVKTKEDKKVLKFSNKNFDALTIKVGY